MAEHKCTFDCPHCNSEAVVFDVRDVYDVGTFACPSCAVRSRVVRVDTYAGFTYWLDEQPWCCDVDCHEVAVYDIRAPLPDPRTATPQEYGEAVDDGTMTCAKHVTPYFLMSYYKIAKVS